MNLPSKSILDPAFRYTSSASTDIRKTFARARREMRQAKQPPSNVQPLPQRRTK